MSRRSLLVLGVLLALMVAGCLGGPGGSNGSSDDDGQGDDGSTTPTDTVEPTTPADTGEPPEPTATDGGSAVRDTSFEVLDVRSSTEDETASLTAEGGTLEIAGRIGGNNGCYTARLAEVELRDETLVVQIDSFEDTTQERDCTQALVTIEYRAVVEMTGTPPASVTVEHNGEPVTSVSV